MKEKIILSIVAAFLGLLVAGGAFYIYQMTRTIDEPEKPQNTITNKSLSPTPQSANFLIVDQPKDEEVTDKKIITVSGKTTPGATIIVSTESSDEVVKPSNNGDFSLTKTLDSGANYMNIQAIFPNGEEQSVKKTITYSTEEF
jgi:hypothetical protein